MTVFYAKLLKLSVVVATSAINTNLFDHKVVCCDPIEPLLSVRDSIVKFDVNIAIKRSVSAPATAVVAVAATTKKFLQNISSTCSGM